MFDAKTVILRSWYEYGSTRTAVSLELRDATNNNGRLLTRQRSRLGAGRLHIFSSTHFRDSTRKPNTIGRLSRIYISDGLVTQRDVKTDSDQYKQFDTDG